MTDTVQAGPQLTYLLERAADGEKGAAESFFEQLLTARVFIPLKPGVQPESAITEVGVGKDHLSERGFSLVEYQGSYTLPIFTEERFVAEWSEGEVNVVEHDFKKLLWLVGDDIWMYVNASQEVGKEITPWEIEQLKQGTGAIPDLVAALREDFDQDLIVRAEDDLFPSLKVQLRPILELYPELEEAFLVAMKEGEDGAEKPTLGVKYRGITEAKRIYLRSELENASNEYLPGHQQLFVVDDLDKPNSPNWRLFAEAKPFYISQRKLPDRSPTMKQRISRLFSRKEHKREQPDES